jgi:hypothetical protein
MLIEPAMMMYPRNIFIFQQQNWGLKQQTCIVEKYWAFSG